MILVAIGANLPAADGSAPLLTCQRAAAALDGLAGARLRALSRWWRTAPVPASDQPDYINGVARLEGAVDPADLLAALQGVETVFGRTRSVPNAARVLDLDLIAIGQLVRAAPAPILPHPRAHERAFVLAPLADVAPGWIHPVSHLTVEVLLARLGPQEARPLRGWHGSRRPPGEYRDE